MILTYKEAITQFGNAYKLSQAVSNGAVYKLEEGIYSTNQREPELGIIMKKYVCETCGYEYDPAVGDPDNGIAPGTAFEDLPADWVCPLCGDGKEVFKPAE